MPRPGRRINRSRSLPQQGPATATLERRQGARMKKAVLIGDSIRRNYQRRVQARLDGEAEVWGPWENCRHSLWALDHYDQWVNPQMAQPSGSS